MDRWNNTEEKICCVIGMIKTLTVFSFFYAESIALSKQNFTLKYDTNIPRQVVRLIINDICSYLSRVNLWNNTVQRFFDI